MKSTVDKEKANALKILMVSQHYKPEPFNVSEVCEGLVRLGHDVTVLTALPNYPDGMVPEEFRRGKHNNEMVDGVRVVRVPIIARGADLKGLNKLRRIANYVSFPIAAWLTRAAMDRHYDCVICMQFSPILMALPALRIAENQGIPCLLWSFDLWPEDMLTGGLNRNGLPFNIMRRVSRRIYGRADMVAVTSPGFSTYFEEQLGLPELKTTWLPQFAEEAFEHVSNAPSYVDEETVFTFAGNIGGNQGVETIVRAAALAADSPVRVRIVGSGSHLAFCKELAAELGADNVEFIDRKPIEAMPNVYANSDVMLLTLSRPADGGSLVPVYTIPRKFQSYLAAGKPVLCAVDGTVGEIVEESGCGVTCPAENPKALADAMRRFSRLNPEERTAMAEGARRLYAERFSRRKFFKRLLESIDDLVNMKGIR